MLRRKCMRPALRIVSIVRDRSVWAYASVCLLYVRWFSPWERANRHIHALKISNLPQSTTRCCADNFYILSSMLQDLPPKGMTAADVVNHLEPLVIVRINPLHFHLPPNATVFADSAILIEKYFGHEGYETMEALRVIKIGRIPGPRERFRAPKTLAIVQEAADSATAAAAASSSSSSSSSSLVTHDASAKEVITVNPRLKYTEPVTAVVAMGGFMKGSMKAASSAAVTSADGTVAGRKTGGTCIHL
jgi:hypothetical protein